jgi:hypothetical protein
MYVILHVLHLNKNYDAEHHNTVHMNWKYMHSALHVKCSTNLQEYATLYHTME